MNKKRNPKGFTLIELIIVLAIFSIILTLVMSFIDPVAKLMSKASIKERTAAYVDNIEEYVDNSIHYAKFVRVYNGGFTDAVDEAVSTDEATAVKSFVDWFLGGVVDPDGNPITGKARVMKLINNDVDLDGDAVVDLEAGHIYESVYDFTAAESYEKFVGTGTYVGTGTFDADGNEIMKEVMKREVHIRPGGADSVITAVSQNKPSINPEHFKDYNYYYKLGFYNLESIPSTDPAYLDAGKRAYYSKLNPMTDGAGNKIEYDSNTGKNFALNVVAYQNQTGGKTSVSYDTDGDSVDDTTEDVFKSPCHMSTASMAFINAIRTNEATSAPFYKLKTKNDGSLDKTADDKVQFEAINSVDMGLAFRLMKPTAGDGNIYIVYILPEEIYDTNIVYK